MKESQSNPWRYVKKGLSLWCCIFLFLLTSCSVYELKLPNTLQPPGTYSAGKGAIGARTSILLPEGADFKIGLTDHIQLSGIASADGMPDQSFEGGLLINLRDSPEKLGTYLTVFAVGGGANIAYRVHTGSTTIFSDTTTQDNISGPTYHFYEGWYPGFQFTRHVGLNLPLRIFEFFGNYQYYETTSGTTSTTTTTTPLSISGAAFVPEIDLCFDWTHINMDIALSTPVWFYNESSPAPVFLYVPINVSCGVYYTW